MENMSIFNKSLKLSAKSNSNNKSNDKILINHFSNSNKNLMSIK